MIRNILIRAASGAIYVALIIGSILLLDHSPLAFFAVFSLFIVIGINEVYGITRGDGDNQSWLVTLIDMLGGIGVFFATYLAMNFATFGRALWLLPLSGYLLLRCIVQLYRPRQNALRGLERSFFALGYVALPLALLHAITQLTTPRILLAVFIFIWVNDTGAYLAGITLGRHKLWERISPKKSWEGLVGGVLACVLTAWGTAHWCGDFFKVPQLGIWLGLSIIVALAATYGDFTESLLKRTAGVKDSGHLIPGHGGLLDRIDSLILVAPAVLIYLILIIYNA